MLSLSRPDYVKAKSAIAVGDAELLASCIQSAGPSLLTVRLREQVFGKELCYSRSDCADVFFGSDRCTEGKISLCCGDFYSHFPFWLSVLPLTRFPVKTWEFMEADPCDTGIKTLLELIPASCAPQHLFAAAKVDDVRQLRVTAEVTTSELNTSDGGAAAITTHTTMQVEPWSVENVKTSLRRLCGAHINPRDSLTVLFAQHEIAENSTWRQEGITEDDAIVELIIERYLGPIRVSREEWSMIPYNRLSASCQNEYTDGGELCGNLLNEAQIMNNRHGTCKWNDVSGNHSTWLQFNANTGPITLVGYALKSANDFPSRDPRSWRLIGSNTGSTEHTVLHEVQGDVWQGERWTWFEWQLEVESADPPSYDTLRLEIDANGDHCTQLGQIKFFTA